MHREANCETAAYRWSRPANLQLLRGRLVKPHRRILRTEDYTCNQSNGIRDFHWQRPSVDCAHPPDPSDGERPEGVSPDGDIRPHLLPAFHFLFIWKFSRNFYFRFETRENSIRVRPPARGRRLIYSKRRPFTPTRTS